MDIIIVQAKEDMERILLWVHDYLCNTPELSDFIEFCSPFQKGEIQFPPEKSRGFPLTSAARGERLLRAIPTSPKLNQRKTDGFRLH